MASEIEKQYSELRKKFKLPEFKEIDFEFELSDLEETNFLIRNIIRRIAEKLDFYTTVIEENLQPDTSNLYAMHETRYFDEYEKKQMYDLYRKLMSFNRQSIEVSLKRNEIEEAEFINKFFSEWKPLKEELLFYVKKMKDSWKKEVDIKEDLGYLG
ncbi:MAG: hypothetical protein HYS80_02645 [Candidatus Aenigmarchaeota archaeon]|nr:hypothetical protein [Candidatus Aenigmarchaeota archaeon]